MTTDEIKERVEKIRKLGALGHGADAAHSEEDALRSDFIDSLTRIGDKAQQIGGIEEIREQAILVKSTGEIEFERYCS